MEIAKSDLILTDISEEKLARAVLLSDRLYEDVRPSFGQSVEVSGGTLGAIEFVSYVIYPSHSNLQARKRFQKAAIWLSIKENPQVGEEEAKDLFKKVPIEYGKNYRYKNAQESMDAAERKLALALEAWQAFDYAESTNTSIKNSLLISGKAYKRGISGAVTSPDNYVSNSQKRVFSAYRGVLHLTEGLVKACLVVNSIEKLNIYILITKSKWVSPAIGFSTSILKSRLLEKYLQSKGRDSGSKVALKPREIVDLYQ